MKLLVFAHVPPPQHGQHYMVKLMLDSFDGTLFPVDNTADRIRCKHLQSLSLFK